MLRYIFRRVLESIPTLLLIVTIAFALLHLAPGAYHADTGQITVRWSAADDSVH